MITGEQIQSCWKKPINAKKKLNWHEGWRGGMETIDVLINGFRVDRHYLRVYYTYVSPTTGKEAFDSDIAEQFKIRT